MVSETVLVRVGSEATAAWKSFVRRRTAVFFTFVFPVIIIGIFGALVETSAGGLFSRPQAYYVPGYLAVVVLLTPLSRVGSSVARGRSYNRFEKLSSTPLSSAEWLAAHTLVNVVLIGLASAVILGVLAVIGADYVLSPWIPVFVAVGVVVFCGLGAVIGRVADSQDGVVAMSNALGLPMLFLAETFVAPEMLPTEIQPLIGLLPLKYFSRGVRKATYPPTGDPVIDIGVLSLIALFGYVVGAYAIPWSE